MRSFILILFLILSGSFSEASEEEKDLKNLKDIPLGQAFMERSTSKFKREVAKLLDGTTVDFFKAINSTTEQGKSIFKLTGEALVKKMLQGKKVEEGEVYAFSEKIDDSNIFFHVTKLFFTLFSPLEKKDEYGRTAMEVAHVWGNQAVYDTLLRYDQIMSEYLFYKLEGVSVPGQEYIGGQIPKIKLEETALAQAILEEDFVEFHQAFEALYSGPAKDFFAVMHSQTKKEESVLHLLAKVQSQQKHFASGTGQVIRSSLPFVVKNHSSQDIPNEQKQWMERAISESKLTNSQKLWRKRPVSRLFVLFMVE